MHTILVYFCNANPNELHALTLWIQYSIIRDLFTESIKFFEKNFKYDFVHFAAILLDFLKSMFHLDSIIFQCCLLCPVSDFIDYNLHIIIVICQNCFKMLFIKIFRFLENCQYRAFGWFSSLLTTRPFEPPISCTFIVLLTIGGKNKFLWAKNAHLWAKFNIFWFLTPPTLPKVH